MNWVIAFAIVLILTIVFFVLFIFSPKPTVFFDPFIDKIELEDFSKSIDYIKKEIEDSKIELPVIPLLYKNTLISKKFPIITNLITNISDVTYAGIIKLKPKFEQIKQYGYAVNANNVLRYFFCVEQSATNKSGIWIDGSKKFFNNNEWICADISREHSLFNKNKDSNTTVLFFDVMRPDSINKGNSPNTDIEKDEVLKAFTLL
jgi:hypothetical protein